MLVLKNELIEMEKTMKMVCTSTACETVEEVIPRCEAIEPATNKLKDTLNRMSEEHKVLEEKIAYSKAILDSVVHNATAEVLQ